MSTMEETTEEFDSPNPPKELVYQDVLNLVSEGKAIIIITLALPR